MTKEFEAVYQGGLLRPLHPLDIPEDQKVMVTVAYPHLPKTADDYLDTELHRYCESRADSSITLAQVRGELSSIKGSLSDAIIEDRQERF